MYLEYLSVQGFKSLADLELADLEDINVFHGFNDTGKSNIVEAMDLFFRLLPLAIGMETGEEWEGPRENEMLPYRLESIFRCQNLPTREITWRARLRPAAGERPVGVQMTLRSGRIAFPLDLTLTWSEGKPRDEDIALLGEPESGFLLLSATRHFQEEHLSDVTPVDRDRSYAVGRRTSVGCAR